jgi:TetR/AcrR family transcriptional regulator, mexJK operon transcriptional repressor
LTDPEHDNAAPRRGGRPSLEQAAPLQETILDVATELFLTGGFGATSIEAVAARARISKRTFYHRFDDKAKLFEAVVHRLIARWRPSVEARLQEPGSFAEILRRAAREILVIVLSPEALALHRVVIAESQRFPALAQVMHESGTKSGIDRIAALLEHEAKAGHLGTTDYRFAAEQFLTMVLAVPQRRALGFGERLSPDELDAWARRTVDLFLHGCRHDEKRRD